MRILLSLPFIFSLTVFAGDPRKDLIGTLEDFKKSEHFIIMYHDLVLAKKACNQLKIVLNKENEGLKILEAQMSDDISLSTLAKLTSSWGVKSVAASPKKNKLGKEESPTFLKLVSERSVQLTESQIAVIDKFKKQPNVLNLQVVRLLKQGLLEKPPLKVEIEDEKRVEFSEFDISTTKNTYLISSKSDKGEVILNLSLNADAVSGAFHYDGKLYEVKPIGKGLHVILEMKK